MHRIYSRMERRERAPIARSGGAELHGHAAGFLNKASGRAVLTDMMSTRARLGIAVAGGLAAILAAAWYRGTDPMIAPAADPTASRLPTGEVRTPTLTLWPEAPTHFSYDRFAWRALLPVPVVPAVPEPVADSDGVELANGPEPVSEEAAEMTGVDPGFRGSEVMTEWVQTDRNRGYRGPWHHFLENWVDPLVVESDGISFYDPSEYPVKSLLPVKLPKAYGFGVKFRASF